MKKGNKLVKGTKASGRGMPAASKAKRALASKPSKSVKKQKARKPGAKISGYKWVNKCSHSMFAKNKRFRSQKNLQWARERDCEVCGSPPPNDPSHLRSQGAGGDDSKTNLMTLCRTHHIQQHRIGIKTFVKKYNLPISWECGWPKRVDIK